MKYFLHLVVVIVLTSTLHDVQQFVTRSSCSEDCSVDRNNVGGRLDSHAVGVLMTGVSAAPKRSERSKLVFHILVDSSDFKKRRSRKRKGKKSLRANGRKRTTNHGRQHLNSRRHRNHYHTLRKKYNKQLKASLKHGNHYHKPRQRKNDLFNKRYQRPFGRKEVTFSRRRYGLKKPTRRPSNKHRPFWRNSRRSKPFHRQDPDRRTKTSFRQNNLRRRPTISRRNHWRRTKKIRHKYSSWRKGNQKREGRQAKNTPRRKKVKKFKAIEFVLYKNKKEKKPRRTKQNIKHGVLY